GCFIFMMDCIIHRDIKPENILLDADLCPKVTDFGLAKVVGREFSRVDVTAKADVFSYGMMLFELVTGKSNVEKYKDSSFTFFPNLATNVVMDGGDILSLLDSRLRREGSVDQVTRICKVAYWCIQDEVDSRPIMSQIMLERKHGFLYASNPLMLKGCVQMKRVETFLPLFVTVAFSSAADTIYANNSLSGDETIISKGNSSNYYIGIWYKKYSTNPPTVVWIANRERPIFDRFKSELLFIDGNLVLLNESKLPIWSTNVTSSTNLKYAVLAVILDDGNLVLRSDLNSVEPIWQSFDHPNHTWLPGAKFAYNKRTNKSQLLTSWKSTYDPGVGLFSLELHPFRIMVLSKWNRSQEYWDTRSWDPLMANSFYKYTYETNENESYFTYYAYEHGLNLPNSGISSGLNLKVNVRETGLSLCNCLTGFHPRSESSWNQSDFSGGCVRKTSLICGRNMEKLDFLMVQVTSLPPIWNGELLNLSEDNVNGKTMFVKVFSEDLPHHKKNNRVVIVVSSIGGLVLVLCIVVLTIYMKKRKLVGKTTMEGSLVAFVYRDLQIATKNFTDKLGGGGFGSVFKGVLRDSSIVAVKKLESVSQGDKQFRSEVSTLGNIQHVNLVRLRRFCAQGNDKLLVYDYMPNGSLHSHLFREKQDDILNWETRYQIALGIARGLVYLHEKCRHCIIHCDIKPENILLDADFCPKIADFGLAKVVGREFSRVLTTIRGTRGYLAPEWLAGVAVTAKADVFSYGMMPFELVTGKRNVEQNKDSSFTFFPNLAASVVMEGGDILSLLDSRSRLSGNMVSRYK
ncbi:hypothetical protein M8C21_026081, partial [Ambrosia artemisiifolia]